MFDPATQTVDIRGSTGVIRQSNRWQFQRINPMDALPTNLQVAQSGLSLQMNIAGKENDDKKSVELINRLEERVRLLEIRAPITGFVNNLKPHTIGGVIARSDVLMEIVPEGWEMIAEIQITPKDIGHVQPGQTVNIKFTAYDFARYGAIPGKLASISASTFLDKNGAPYYKEAIQNNLHICY